MPPVASGAEAGLLSACGAHLEQIARLMQQEGIYASGQSALPEDREELRSELARTATALSECLQLGSPTEIDCIRRPSYPNTPPPLSLSAPGSRPARARSKSHDSAQECSGDVRAPPASSGTPPALVTVDRTTPQGGDVKDDWEQDQMVLRQLRSRKGSTTSLRDMEEQSTLQKQQCLAYRFLQAIVGNPRYEAFWATVVLLNTVTMILEEEHAGISRGNELGVYKVYGSKEHLETWWPEAQTCFFVIDCIFAAMFTAEIIMTFSYDLATLHLGLNCQHRRPFWREPWDILDLFIVCFSNSTLFIGTTGPAANTRFLRIFRLVKLLRLVRLVRKVHSLDALHLMTTAIRGSVSALIFSTMLLVLILTLFAMLFSQFLRESYLGPGSPLAPEVQYELYLYFGSYSRSMLSLFELALANWPQLCRFLMEEVHEGFGVFCIGYKLSVGFAVLGVINGVFIQETFAVAAHDEFIMVRSRLRQVNQHKDRISRLFHLADQDNDGRLTRLDLRFMMAKRAIRTWLEAMDVRCQDGDMLFDLLSRDGEAITLPDFVSGIGRLKGSARTIDLLEVTQNQNEQIRHLMSHREPNCVHATKRGCRECQSSGDTSSA